jgi:peptidoglycan/LPS O-acetylase OafA/YrhL
MNRDTRKEPSTTTPASTAAKQTTFPQTGNSTVFLDGCRGLAAFYVVVGHARYLLTAGYRDGFIQHAADYGYFNTACFYFLALFRYGQEAVLFFFVLSGFVIHYRQAKGLASSPTFHLDWKQYFWRRARRLYPPLILAIIATWFLDYAGMRLGWPIYSGQTQSIQINQNLHPVHDPLTLLGNLAFLMRCYVPVWGSDGPLWSLHYEWWFYMFYPLFFLLTRKSWAMATLLMIALYALAHIHLPDWTKLFTHIFAMMIIWWMGALLADMHARRIRVPMKFLAAMILLLPLGMVAEPLGRGHLPDLFLSNVRLLALGAGFTGVIAAGFFLQSRGIRLTYLNRLKWLGEMSYTLYVLHFPILVFIGGWLMWLAGENVLPRHSGWVVPGVAVAMLLAFVAHFGVERPFLPQQRRIGQEQR